MIRHNHVGRCDDRDGESKRKANRDDSIVYRTQGRNLCVTQPRRRFSFIGQKPPSIAPVDCISLAIVAVASKRFGGPTANGLDGAVQHSNNSLRLIEYVFMFSQVI